MEQKHEFELIDALLEAFNGSLQDLKKAVWYSDRNSDEYKKVEATLEMYNATQDESEFDMYDVDHEIQWYIDYTLAIRGGRRDV